MHAVIKWCKKKFNVKINMKKTNRPETNNQASGGQGSPDPPPPTGKTQFTFLTSVFTITFISSHIREIVQRNSPSKEVILMNDKLHSANIRFTLFILRDWEILECANI